MKITNVVVDVLEVPVENAYVAAGRQVAANWHVAARIRTGDGVEGFGYIVKTGEQLMRSVAQAARELGEILIGMNALETEAAWQKMATAGKWAGPGGLLHWAIAPLDIAMWDAAGKIFGQPLYRLLGGYRDHIPAYASDWLWYSLSNDQLAESAQNHAKNGYSAIKLRLGKELTPKQQAERARLAGNAAGADVAVMVDGTESWDLPYARAAGRLFQEAGVTWLEDPVNHADVAGLASLAAELDIPVTGGENLYTLDQFRHTLEARAVDVAILDLFRVGGITPWRKIAALAESHRVQISGHVAPEFHVHLLAAAPNGKIVEYMPRSTAILQEMPEPKDGILTAPDRPGHGLALDQAAFDRCRVE
jgi:L-alanine-DL-glutamate epimerase-like enolase superfamily enzyme